MRRRAPFLALWLLASPLAARAAAVEPLYEAPAASWHGALDAAAAGAPLSPSLAALGAPGAPTAPALAPVVAQLSTQLQLTPAAFSALPHSERRAALEMSVEAAQAELSQKAAVLVAETRALAAPERTLDRNGRAELHRVVAHLDEMRGYGALLPSGELQAVSDSYDRAAARFLAVREALVRRRMEDDSAALSGDRREDDGAGAVTEAPSLPAPRAGKAARDLAAAMRNNSVGWKLRDLDHLLAGHGFTLDQGGKHRKYEFPGLKPVVVPRQVAVDPSYVRNALAAIDRVEGGPAPEPARATAPVRIDLGSLSLLGPGD